MNKWQRTTLKNEPPPAYFSHASFLFSCKNDHGETPSAMVTDPRTQSGAGPHNIGVIDEAQAIAGSSDPQAAQMAARRRSHSQGIRRRAPE